MNGLLIDSNVLLWWLRRDDRLIRGGHYDRINNTRAVFLSVLSPWELWIKHAAGKLPMGSDLAERIQEAGFTVLSPTLVEAQLAARLPPLHKDPFDRMLVAQAMSHGLPLMTSDELLGQYGVKVILV